MNFIVQLFNSLLKLQKVKELKKSAKKSYIYPESIHKRYNNQTNIPSSPIDTHF